MALPNAEVLFGDSPDAPKLSKAEVATRFDGLMKAVDTAPVRVLGPQDVTQAFSAGHGIDFTARPTTAYGALTKALQAPELTKGISAEALASVTSALDELKAQQPDLVKDITTSSPVSTGLVAFDLEAPSFS
ncbi:hypothetical protein [Streptomyces mirabilis]|uniref:hypothetical protein n=1 Tax=Streptomyces mirabilis TaxID=68239 RepID=UPI00340C5AD4